MATTGHESEAINVQGLKASLQKFKTDKVDGKADKVTVTAGSYNKVTVNSQGVVTAGDNPTTLAGHGITDAYTKSETYTKTEVNGLVDTPHQNYVTVQATAQTTDATDVLPASGQAADTIYRVSCWDGDAGAFDVTKYSEYAWDDQSNPNKYVFLCVKTAIGEVFDITVYNNNTEYADLASALGTNGVNVPESLRKGGMSVKFVQSPDHKYVQYRLMADEWSTVVVNWQGVDDVPTAGSNNLVKSSGVDIEISQLKLVTIGIRLETVFEITSTGEHSSNKDRITFQKTIPAGEYSITIETGTTGNTGTCEGVFVAYVDQNVTTNLGSLTIGTPKTMVFDYPVVSIGIYMRASVNQNTGTMPLTIVSKDDNLKKNIEELGNEIDSVNTALSNGLELVNAEVEANKKYLLNNRFIGKGSSFSSVEIYGLKKGKTYTIELQDPSLCSDTSSDTSVAKFYVSYQNGESTFTNLVNIRVGSGDVAATYNFTIPNDFIENGKVIVGGRAVIGKVVNFFIKSIEYETYGMVRCSTAANVADKVVTIPNLTSANTEAIRFVVVMSHSTSVNSKLKVNDAEAKNLYYNGALASSSNSWEDGEKLDITYNKNYPAYFAVTIPNFTKSINAQSPSNNKFASESAIVSYIKSIGQKSVQYYNADKIPAIISAVSRNPLVYEKNNSSLCFAFSVLTDLHSDIARFERACKFADDVSEITATLCLGDMINTSNTTNPYPLILNYNKAIIPITGNHEVLKKSAESITGWDETALLSNMYSSDLVAHNGEIHPEGKCYWYKDFTKTIDGTAKKLRVIGLHQYESNGTGDQNTGSGKDVTFYSQSQIDWLIERLDECDVNTMVMILVHFAPTNAMTKIDGSFTPSNRFNFPTSGGSTTGGSNNSMSDNLFLPKIIQAWIDGTTLDISCNITVGETVTTITAVKSTAFAAHDKQFAGWFTGHTHKDIVCKITDYPKQMVFSFICSSATSGQQYGDVGRTTTEKSQDCFTVVSIDWFTKAVNLIRIGADVTTDMRERKYSNYLLT